MVVGDMCKNNKSIYLQDAWSVRRESKAISNVEVLALQWSYVEFSVTFSYISSLLSYIRSRRLYYFFEKILIRLLI